MVGLAVPSRQGGTQAYGQEFTPFFTDDASVVEAMGVPVHLAEGNRENIKITTPFDLKIGSALL